MCHWGSRPAVRGAGPARTAREGPWGAPAGRPASAALRQSGCHPAASPALGWARRARCREGSRERLRRGREEDQAAGLRPGAQGPESGRAALASRGARGRARCRGVQGGDPRWRVAGEAVSRGPLLVTVVIPPPAGPRRGSCGGPGWLSDRGCPAHTLPPVWVSPGACCSPRVPARLESQQLCFGSGLRLAETTSCLYM